MLPMLRGHEDVDAFASQSDISDMWRAGSDRRDFLPTSRTRHYTVVFGVQTTDVPSSLRCRLAFLNTGCNSAKRARKSNVALCQAKQSTAAYVGQDLLLYELLFRATTGKPFHHRIFFHIFLVAFPQLDDRDEDT